MNDRFFCSQINATVTAAGCAIRLSVAQKDCRSCAFLTSGKWPELRSIAERLDKILILAPEDRDREVKYPCSVEGCGEPKTKNGLCYRCYVKKYGLPPYRCKVKGCKRPIRKNGLCYGHFRQVYGAPSPHRNATLPH